ncbi:MAG: hypothetical protein ACYS47_04320 [Planctomycetota bacterium]
MLVTKNKVMASGPKAVDFMNLSLLAKAWGVLILAGGLLILAFSAWGVPLLALGVIFIITGIGLGRYRMWGWYMGVIVLVPLNILGAVAAALFMGLTSYVSFGLILMVLSGIYVGKVLLSKGGRARYRKIVEARVYAENNPDSLTARMYGKRKGRGRGKGSRGRGVEGTGERG